MPHNLQHVMHKPAPGQPETAQQRFDRLYITSAEICRDMQVSRPTVLAARRRRLLPDPVSVCGASLFIWERETVAPYLAAWQVILGVRRSTDNTEHQPA